MRQLDTNTEEIESTLQELDMHEDSEDQNYQLLVITIWLPIIIWEWAALQGGEFSWGSIFCDTVCSETLQIDHTASAGIGL